MVGFVRLKDYVGVGYNKVILIFKGDYCWQVASEKETYNILKFIHQGFIKNPLFIKKKIRIWQKHKKDFLAQCRKVSLVDLHKLDNKNLWRLYKQFQKSYIKEFTTPLFIEGTNFYSALFLKEKLKDKSLSEATKIYEAVNILSQPVKKTFFL